MGEHNTRITLCGQCERGHHGKCGGEPLGCGCALEVTPIGGVRSMDIGDVRPVFQMLNERFTNEHSPADTLADVMLRRLEELLCLRADALAEREACAAALDALAETEKKSEAAAEYGSGHHAIARAMGKAFRSGAAAIRARGGERK